ncbi:MAG: rhomboid family intramembrane serine protease, partial [Thermoanaerobaculia bacterium]
VRSAGGAGALRAARRQQRPGRQAWTWAVMLFVVGFMMRGVDNYAHLGGFLGGYCMAKWLDPLLPERVDHLVAALAVLVLSALAIVASLLLP